MFDLVKPNRESAEKSKFEVDDLFVQSPTEGQTTL